MAKILPTSPMLTLSQIVNLYIGVDGFQSNNFKVY